MKIETKYDIGDEVRYNHTLFRTGCGPKKLIKVGIISAIHIKSDKIRYETLHGCDFFDEEDGICKLVEK